MAKPEWFISPQKMASLLFIPYNTSNKDRARLNRQQPTKSEQLIRAVVRKKKLWHLFLRQKMIGSFILDFYCSKLLLGIEIDGSSHDDKIDYDAMRTLKIQEKWIKILRYTNDDVLKNIEWVINNLEYEIQIREKELGMQIPSISHFGG